MGQLETKVQNLTRGNSKTIGTQYSSQLNLTNKAKSIGRARILILLFQTMFISHLQAISLPLDQAKWNLKSLTKGVD